MIDLENFHEQFITGRIYMQQAVLSVQLCLVILLSQSRPEEIGRTSSLWYDPCHAVVISDLSFPLVANQFTYAMHGKEEQK